MPANRKLSPERAELLAGLVAEGVSVRRMQTLYGFNRLTVLRHYPELHTAPTPIPEETKRLVRGMAGERAPLSAICEVSGLTRGQVLDLEPNVSWSRREASEYARLFQQQRGTINE